MRARPWTCRFHIRRNRNVYHQKILSQNRRLLVPVNDCIYNIANSLVRLNRTSTRVQYQGQLVCLEPLPLPLIKNTVKSILMAMQNAVVNKILEKTQITVSLWRSLVNGVLVQVSRLQLRNFSRKISSKLRFRSLLT